jgi:rhodanese-related sulfurtransferase
VLRWSLLFALLLAGFSLAACGSLGESAGSDGGSRGAPAGKVGEKVSAPGGSYTRVSPTELKGMMQREDLVLVNTHVPFEGNIPGTDLSIPYNEIGRRAHRLPVKDARIALYCRSGTMSAEAARTLVRLGYTDVSDLGGGMLAWEKAGFPLKGA